MKKNIMIVAVIAVVIIGSLVITFELNTDTAKLKEKSSKGFLTFEEGEQKFTSEKTLTGKNLTITLTEKVGVKTP